MSSNFFNTLRIDFFFSNWAPIYVLCLKEFWENYLKLCGSCAFQHNFHIRKLGEIKAFYTVPVYDELFS